MMEGHNRVREPENHRRVRRIRRKAGNTAVPGQRKLLSKQNVLSIGIVLVLAAILVVLAALQYHWTGQVSQAERERMRTSLATATFQFRQDFNTELQQLAFLYQPGTAVLAGRDWRSYAENCAALPQGADRHLVTGLYLWLAGSPQRPQLLKLNLGKRVFEPAPWPSGLESVRNRFEWTSVNPERAQVPGRLFSWAMIPRIPLLLRPLSPIPSPAGAPKADEPLIGYLMMELSLDIMRRELLPELAEKHFAGPDGFIYQVAIVGSRDPGVIIYRSDPALSPADFSGADARISLLESPRWPDGRRGTGGPGGFRPRPVEDPPPPTGPSPPEWQAQRGPRGGGLVRLAGDDEGNWDLIVRHRGGSLDAVVATLRRRNLAVGFGILTLLAGSMGLIIAFTQRMQRLARQQMDFVAGISHELRTPLAVICSAGDNLADSAIADSGTQVRQYGELIRGEGWKLTNMVEQILHVASVQSGRRRYSLRSARIEEIIEAVLEQVRPSILAAGFTVEKSIEPDLPRVSVDAEALSKCIQNLIQNALKYSGGSRWLAVRLGTVQGARGRGVRLVVEDRGIGIDRADLPHIFDAFYRGRAAADAQIHGTGLGLFVVREAMTAMGGTVSVQSTPGKGSTFTIQLPALPPDGAARGSKPDASPEAADEPE